MHTCESHKHLQCAVWDCQIKVKWQTQKLKESSLGYSLVTQWRESCQWGFTFHQPLFDSALMFDKSFQGTCRTSSMQPSMILAILASQFTILRFHSSLMFDKKSSKTLAGSQLFFCLSAIHLTMSFQFSTAWLQCIFEMIRWNQTILRQKVGGGYCIFVGKYCITFLLRGVWFSSLLKMKQSKISQIWEGCLYSLSRCFRTTNGLDTLMHVAIKFKHCAAHFYCPDTTSYALV